MHKPLTEMTPAELRDYADHLELQDNLKSIPTPLPDKEIDFKRMADFCEKCFEDMVTVGIQEEEFMNCVAELALEVVYGKKIFEWMNKQMS